MNNQSISVVLPVYNEERNITKVVTDSESVLKSISREYEIIIVDDGSTDATREIVDKLAKGDSSIRGIYHSVNKGYAAALNTGFSSAGKELIFYTDTDNQFVLSDLKKLLQLIEEADIVAGYRAHRGDNFIRILTSKVFNLLGNIFFGLQIKDVNCAFKLFRKEVFEKIQIECEGFMFDIEVLAKAKLYKMAVKQVEVEHLPRFKDKSSVKFKDIYKTLKGLIKLKKIIGREKNNVL